MTITDEAPPGADTSSPRSRPRGSTGRPTGPKKFRWRRFGVAMLVIYVLSSLLLQSRSTANVTSIPYTSFTQQVDANNVATIHATGGSIDGTLRKPQPVPGGTKGQTYTTFSTFRPIFAQDTVYATMVKNGVQISAKSAITQQSWLQSLLLSLIPIALIAGIWIWISRRGTSMLSGFGNRKSSTPVDVSTIRVTFADVAGIAEVTAELSDVVDFLKHPEKYRRLGATVPRGVLLAGLPGTGKTLLARAVAGEAGVPFFSASASEFIEMIVGVGASRVRKLFDEARKVAPAIIFLDEIDAIGRARGGNALGGNDEREQTLNQILTEMDGFTGREGVIVIAATNRADVLDPALLRPGRFDRVVQVSAPDTVGRAEILRVHTRDVPLANSVDLTEVAKSTPGMTGADLANLANEAALLAAKLGEETVTAADFANALEKIQLGAARSVVMAEDERRRTAFHEAGHALLGMLVPGADPVRKVSIIPRGHALGVTLSTPDGDRYGYDESYLRGRIIGALGGIASEELVFGVTSTGAESDLDQLTHLARSMVGRWGMSPVIGRWSALTEENLVTATYPPAPATLDAVDAEVQRIVGECYEQAQQLLRANRDRLDGLASALLERETLDARDARAAAGFPSDQPPSLVKPAAVRP
ncbi:MAG: cell division protease FtsH [Pseudonocardiales bacterium]|jgi:cell division protease FtsH|nr:cell division protease FtsH [Pseudonocardiales bacterium]